MPATASRRELSVSVLKGAASRAFRNGAARLCLLLGPNLMAAVLLWGLSWPSSCIFYRDRELRLRAPMTPF